MREGNEHIRGLVPTGIDGLDEIFFGGIIKGNVIVLEGMPGTGKTTLALEFLYRGALEYDEPGVIVTFETSPNKVIRDAAGFGWDLHALERAGKLKIIYTAPSVLLEELQSHDGVLSQEIQKLKAKRVVIDGLTPLKVFGERLNGRPFRDSLHLLIETLQRFDTTILLTTESTGTNPIGETGSGQEQFLCDTILTVRNQARRRSVHRSIEIAKSRGQDFIGGRHSLKIQSDEGIKVFPRVYARPKILTSQPSSFSRSSTGNPPLDRMLGGGVYDGSVTLVVGISGTGKTVSGTQFLVEGAKSGKKGLLISLDEHPDQIMRNAKELEIDLAGEVEKENVVVLYDSPLELDLDEHFYRIKQLVQEHNIQRVLIDSLAAYESAQPEEAHEFIVALAAYFKENLIATVFNFECPELLGVSQISDKMKVSAIVDNIILLNYVEISTLLRRAITVPKARGSNPNHRTKEYLIQKGGFVILEDQSVEDIAAVPQLPFSSYYSVLARSPTRKSPVIEEHLASGKELPSSQIPVPGSTKKAKSLSVKKASKNAKRNL